MAKRNSYITMRIKLRFEIPLSRPSWRKLVARLVSVRDELATCTVDGDLSHMRDSVEIFEQLVALKRRARASQRK